MLKEFELDMLDTYGYTVKNLMTNLGISTRHNNSTLVNLTAVLNLNKEDLDNIQRAYSFLKNTSNRIKSINLIPHDIPKFEIQRSYNNPKIDLVIDDNKLFLLKSTIKVLTNKDKVIFCVTMEVVTKEDKYTYLESEFIEVEKILEFYNAEKTII